MPLATTHLGDNNKMHTDNLPTHDVRPENIRLQPSRVYGRITARQTEHPIDRGDIVTSADVEREIALAFRQREAAACTTSCCHSIAVLAHVTLLLACVRYPPAGPVHLPCGVRGGTWGTLRSDRRSVASLSFRHSL